MGATDGSDPYLDYKKHDPTRPYLRPADKFYYENHQDVNFFFMNLTTPANYFHALRRVMKLDYRKPLVIAAPKISKRGVFACGGYSCSSER